MTPFAHFYSCAELAEKFHSLGFEIIDHEKLNLGALHCFVLRKHPALRTAS